MIVPLLALAAVLQTARLAVFMASPGREWGSILPAATSHHCCLTAYANGAALLRAGDDNPWQAKAPDVAQVAAAGPFHLDSYEYPPPFLALVRLVWAGSTSFEVLRLRFFLVQSLALALALAFLARRLAGRAPGIVPLLFVVWLSVPALGTLEKGNVHVLLVALALGAVLAWEQGHDRLGGALLALPIALKFFPAILLVPELVAGRWRRAGWALAAVGLLAGITLPLLGTAPFHTFLVYQLPRLANGSAFGFMTGREPTLASSSIDSLVLRLHLLGLPVYLRAGRALTVIYAAGVGALAIGWGMRLRRGASHPAVVLLGGLALFVLAERSAPFAPDYTLLAPEIVAVLLLVAVPMPARNGRALASRLLLASLIVLWGFVDVYLHGTGRTWILYTLVEVPLAAIAVGVFGLRSASRDVSVSTAA